ncbi:hypothetical protein LNP18_10150 [Leuconostoc citreum]|uniref:hypothetical protein n=1 Tax=Leuconostoc citreum TaxID=33964 RepID=UPI00200B9146|nr:hypothetical protein [Leuconostoc citreum]MCK8606455.1 hypothetical protein [Leuconostoc citreum]
MNILIISAAGPISRKVTERLLNETDDRPVLFDHDAKNRLLNYKDNNQVPITAFNFLDGNSRGTLMKVQDVV